MDWTPETPGSQLPFEPKMAVLSPFDHNAAKYRVFGRFHIIKVARFVSILLILGTVAQLIFALTRPSAIVFYGFITGAFAAGIYGSLVYGVYKEKKMMLVPFLIFQGIFLVVTALIMLGVILITAFSRDALLKLGSDILDTSQEDTDENVTHVRKWAIFFIFLNLLYIALETWIFTIIYRFNLFLKERETSFGFSMEPEFRMDPLSMD